MIFSSDLSALHRIVPVVTGSNNLKERRRDAKNKNAFEQLMREADKQQKDSFEPKDDHLNLRA